eukprot:57854-Rhodomonas_salina.3
MQGLFIVLVWGWGLRLLAAVASQCLQPLVIFRFHSQRLHLRARHVTTNAQERTAASKTLADSRFFGSPSSSPMRVRPPAQGGTACPRNAQRQNSRQHGAVNFQGISVVGIPIIASVVDKVRVVHVWLVSTVPFHVAQPGIEQPS